MPVRKRALVPICAVVGLALASTVVARVYMRVPAAPTMQIEALGGNQVYAGPFTVNGVEAQVRAYTFEGAAEPLSRTLMSRLGVKSVPAENYGAFIKLPAGRGDSCLLLLPGNDGVGLTALLVTSAQKLNADGAGDAAWIIPNVPQPTGFTPTFNAVDEQTSTSLCIGASASPAAAALQLAMAQVEGFGWTAISPAPERTSLRMFERGDKLMIMCAIPREHGCSMLFMQKGTR